VPIARVDARDNFVRSRVYAHHGNLLIGSVYPRKNPNRAAREFNLVWIDV